MAFIFYNPNPSKNLVGDCVIRAISKITGQDWETTYIGVAVQGYKMNNMPTSNAVWGAYLRELGFKSRIIPNDCPECYTVKDFCNDNPKGSYILATGDHVVAVMNGDYYDTWDSGNEIPAYYWIKKGDRQ